MQNAVLKGYQRRMIMVPTKSSPLFETAYFILRKETEKAEPLPDEMLCEATRIIKGSETPKRTRPIKKRHLLLAFLTGGLSGGTALALAWWIFTLLTK